jgi:lambda family phage tail tape measure protein
MALATLSIDLEARLAKLEEGMSRATRVAERSAAAIEARYTRIGSAVRAVAGVIGSAFAGVSLGVLVRNTVNGVDALNDLRDATGASIENLSALEDVADRTGTGFQEMGSSLIRFNKVLADAKPGSDAANIFKTLGLDVARLRALDPAEALRQVAVALSGYAVEGGKARAVQELFGKSVKDAAPFLDELAKRGKLVATVTTEQAAEVEKFNQELDGLQKNVKDTARELTSSLIPALNRLFEKRREQGFLALLGFDKDFSEKRRLAELASEVSSLDSYLKKLQADKSGGVGYFKNVDEQIVQTIADLERAKAAFRAADPFNAVRNLPPTGAGGGRGDVNPEPVKPRLPDIPDSKTPKAAEIDEATRALAQYVAQLDKERGTIKDLSTEQEALNFLKSLGSRGEIPQVRELVLGLAAEVDQRRDAAEMTELQAKAQEALTRKQVESRRALDTLLSQTPASRGDELADVSGALDEAFLKGEVTATKYTEALALVDKQLADLKDPAKEAAKNLDEFSKQAARNIQDALGDTVLATLQGKFDNIGQLWGNLIQRMAAQALSAKLGELLLGSFGTTGQVGGAFGSLFSLLGFAKGGAFSQGALQPFATGGVVSRPTVFPFANGTGLMGEAGEEAILPLKRGRDGKLGVAQAGSGSGAPPITINVDGGMNRNEVFAAISLAMNALRGELQQSLRAAGVA